MVQNLQEKFKIQSSLCPLAEMRNETTYVHQDDLERTDQPPIPLFRTGTM